MLFCYELAQRSIALLNEHIRLAGNTSTGAPMQIRHTLRCKTWLVVFAIALVVAGCSRMNLAYRNLHLLIPWSLNDYLDMNSEQQKAFRSQLREHLSWHCKTQLPSYLDKIEHLQQQVRQGDVDEAALRMHYRDAKDAIDAIVLEIKPTTTRLLRDLDDEQVRQLHASLVDERRKREDKYLKPPLEKQISERAERMQERVDQWLGSTSASQRQRIREWAHTLGPQNQLWLDNRAQWQRALVAALDKRDEQGFEEQVAKLLQDRESLWTAEYQAAFARAEQAGIDLAVDLFVSSDAKQRRHLDGQLEDLRKDLGSLDCLPKPR